MFYGRKPEGATHYSKSADGKFEFVAWSPPPERGDQACLGLTGRTENQLVRDILDGRYNCVFEKEDNREKVCI